jgi:uncharacterized membrane protein
MTLAVMTAIGAVLAVGWLVLRWRVGPAAALSRKTGLYVIRAVLIASLIVICLNPVYQTQSPGLADRPEIFYLIDSSQSMQLGAPSTRWNDAMAAIKSAGDEAKGSPVDIKLFRFGQRLLASDDFETAGLTIRQLEASRPLAAPGLTSAAYAAESVSPAGGKTKPKATLAPTDADTQLITALRQISSRFGHKPPAGIVLFSDGRARDESGVDEIVSQFARLKVPVHVMPTGTLGKRGDISIAAAVVPPRVRKFTDVEVQVFLRSFGFDGYRTEVVVSIPPHRGQPARKLTSVPVTLHSGFQAVTLTFRSTTESHPVHVEIAAATDEISDSNNTLNSEIAIDRTKIRVLYLEGSSQPLTATIVNGRQVIRGAYSDVSQALMTDDDIECVVVTASAGGSQLMRVSEQGLSSDRGFPETKAELAAFDAIIISDVPERALTETQIDWIEEWVGQRGGGLLMTGGSRSFSAGGWNQTKLADLLPVEMLPGSDWNSSEQIAWKPLLGAAPHPIWSLYTEERRTQEALANIPGFIGASRFAAVKPNLTLTISDSSILGQAPATPPPVQQDPGQVQDFFRRIVGGEAGTPERMSSTEGTSAALVVGRYGSGRTAALSTAITPPWASDFNTQWKQGDQNNFARFWRNMIYWLTENSSIGRRRLIASADKRFYNPGDMIEIGSSAFNELARQTKDYRIVAMIEPNSSLKDLPGDYSPLKWPDGVPRTSGEEGPYIAWGEELEIPLVEEGDKPRYGLKLPIADALQSGAASQSLRLELTAYEDLTQVDSTSLDIQVLHDPFELQNPFPNHELLSQIARLSGGKVLDGPDELAAVLKEIPVKVGPPIISRTPAWSAWPVWAWLVGLLTAEWLWRRRLGLA